MANNRALLYTARTVPCRNIPFANYSSARPYSSSEADRLGGAESWRD
jgi:hypothetical protein